MCVSCISYVCIICAPNLIDVIQKPLTTKLIHLLFLYYVAENFLITTAYASLITVFAIVQQLMFCIISAIRHFGHKF